MNFTIRIAALVGILFLGAWQAPKKNSMQHVIWLVGTWAHVSGKDTIYESWQQQSDTSLKGISYSLHSNDTIVWERIQIKRAPDGWYYIPAVANQNNQNPIPFFAPQIKDSFWKFENKVHDYPQQIIYQKWNEESLVATISGVRSGQYHQQSFPMKRVK